MPSDPDGALRSIVMVLSGASEEISVNIFRGYGGVVRFSGGTYAARLCRITATCTEGERAAVKSWLRKAKEVLSTKE